MEAGLRSRKRKQRSPVSDPFAGIFTRSRSQIYFHRHRSGYARSDSNRSRNLIKSLKGTTKLLVNEKQSECAVGQVTSQASVIDLRARRVFSPATIADDVVSIGGVDLDICKKNDGNPNVSVFEGDLGVSASAAFVYPSSVRENEVMEADAVVAQMMPAIAKSEENKRIGDKVETIPVEENKRIATIANEIEDVKGLMSKSQSSVTRLRGRRKVFKSPTSFNYKRLLPYITDSWNDDSSSFEIVDAALPKVMKSSIAAPNTVALKDDQIGLVSNSSKLADGSLNSSVESSGVGQKSQEDVLNDTLEDCEQMTPPDSDIYCKSKNDNIVGVLVNPRLKPALKSCSRRKILQTPTSFSHRRLLPFLMSVAEDYSCPLKSNQSVKLDKAIEQNQQPLTQSLSHQDETSNSPTSTLVPVDTTKTVTLVSNDNVLDANEPDKEQSGSDSQLEVNLQVEVNSDSCIKLEQSPPKSNLKCVEEVTPKVTPLCIEQSYSEDRQITVKESPQQYLLQVCEYNGENIKNGILKRTPRGCRGICNCLNCTSFRLHAERSFEFSKNQLHDAEEVALELINDLTSLRNILETTSSYSRSLDTVKEKQVKEACAKALYKEQVARARLAQMNEDLSIHCRSMNLLRPKVTFANKIEEKVISNDEIYGKKSV